jgi:VacB/RNase II family 3'-5' exoribonuclease
MLKKTIQGTVKYTKQSFGFLETQNNQSYFIPPQELKKVLPNDIVECSIKIENDKEFVVIHKLIKKCEQSFVGKVEKGGNNYFLNIEDSPLSLFIEKNSNLKETDWVKCRLNKHPMESGKSSVRFEEFVSENNDDRLYWNLAIKTNEIKDLSFDEKQIENNLKVNMLNRKDLTNKHFFTVDGNVLTIPEAKKEKRDRDDAVCIERYNSGYKVYVAISDVAEFVKEGTPLDNYALNNTTSYYLLDKVIPMLPRKLSEDYLSLNEKKDRAVIVCEMEIKNNGEVKSYDFYEALINSKAQLSYNMVTDYCNNGVPNEYMELKNDIISFKEVGLLRKNYRENNNTVQENRVEYKISLLNSKINNIYKIEQQESARYIEELMVSANACYGLFIKDKEEEAIYNDFSGFSKGSEEELSLLLNTYNLGMKVSDLYIFKGYKKFQKKLSKKPENVKTLFNFHLSKAKLSKLQVPHFGLGIETGYATFTSPLRKYIDLINHRILKSILRNENVYKVNEDQLISLKANQLKQRTAENYIKNSLYLDYMGGRYNEEYKGQIVFMNARGARIKLEETGIVGFLPNEELANSINQDFRSSKSEFIYDEKKLILNDIEFKIGDKFNIKLKNVNKYKKEINLKIA